MRRNDRAITDLQAIQDIIRQCRVFRVAMSEGTTPYVVPLNFGYACTDGRFEFYFHGAAEGRKLDILRQNSAVCFEMDCNHELVPGPTACSYSYRYSSVIGSGHAEMVTASEDKMRMLSAIMKHQTGRDVTFTEEQVQAVAVCKITVSELSAKQHI